MQQKDQESSTAPKKHWKKALDMNDNKSPSVAARSAIFENNKVCILCKIFKACSYLFANNYIQLNYNKII